MITEAVDHHGSNYIALMEAIIASGHVMVLMLTHIYHCPT